MKKAVLSLSGGMDSTCLLLHLLKEGYEVRCYSFDYGQRHSLELKRVRENVSYLWIQEKLPISWNLIDLKSVFNESSSALILQSGVSVPEGHYADENMKLTVVENRNGIFSSIIYGKALSWANQIQENVLICLGIHAGDATIYPDCRPESREAFKRAFEVSNWGSEKVDYYTPFLHVGKYEILLDAYKSCDSLKLNFQKILASTNTCYNPNEKEEACGKCGACVERLEAFDKLNIKDPVTYQ